MVTYSPEELYELLETYYGTALVSGILTAIDDLEAIQLESDEELLARAIEEKLIPANSTLR